MIGDTETLERIHRAVRHYLSHDITEGETLGDIVEALEAGGRALFGQVSSDDRPGLVAHAEPRSWAPTRATGPARPRRRTRQPGRTRPEARA